MAADPLRCPACSGALSKPGQPRCEWCGVTLPAAAPAAAASPRGPAAPSERDRLASVLEQMQRQPPAATRSHGAGCLFFVLLLLAALFVFFLAFTPRTIAPSATPEPPGPYSAPTDIEKPDPPRGQ